MFAAKITFRFPSPSDGDLKDQTEGLMALWIKNGQILGFGVRVDHNHGLDFYVRLPEISALDPKNDNDYTRKKRKKLAGQGLQDQGDFIGKKNRFPCRTFVNAKGQVPMCFSPTFCRSCRPFVALIVSGLCLCTVSLTSAVGSISPPLAGKQITALATRFKCIA